MTMSSQIIEVLDHLCAKFGIVIDWSATNVVPYMQELMTKFANWEIGTSKVWICVGVCMLILSLAIIIAGRFLEWGGIELLFTVPCIVVFAWVIVEQAIDIVTCNTFPEKIIFDYIQVYLNR